MSSKNPNTKNGMTLNESPSEKEGKLNPHRTLSFHSLTLNESPSEKEGKCARQPTLKRKELNPQ